MRDSNISLWKYFTSQEIANPTPCTQLLSIQVLSAGKFWQKKKALEEAKEGPFATFFLLHRQLSISQAMTEEDFPEALPISGKRHKKSFKKREGWTNLMVLALFSKRKKTQRGNWESCPAELFRPTERGKRRVVGWGGLICMKLVEGKV